MSETPTAFQRRVIQTAELFHRKELDMRPLPGGVIQGKVFLSRRGEQPLCLKCAGMDDLVFLAAEDAAVPRRARKHSSRSAVVVRYSRARQPYEREGVLVEAPAVARAEEELDRERK
jgi:hypothetical protein